MRPGLRQSEVPYSRMRYALLALLALLMLCAGCGCASLEYPDPSQTSVRIEMGDKVCSATSVGAHTLLTATHCLSGEAGLLTIEGKDSTWKLIASDNKDHSLIRVSLKQRSIARVGAMPPRGALLVKYGNPMGLRGLVIYGRVAGYLSDGTMLADMTGYKGDSGSALYDEQGRIVGVVSAIGGANAFYLVAAFPLNFKPEDWARVA